MEERDAMDWLEDDEMRGHWEESNNDKEETTVRMNEGRKKKTPKERNMYRN